MHLHKIDGNNKGCLEVEECNSVPKYVSFNNELNSMRIKHVSKLIMAYLNINSLRNKFEFLVEFIRGKVDILMISEKSLILPNRQHRYELGNNPDFGVPIVISVHKGLKSLSYFSPKIWELLPLEIKETETLKNYPN